MQKEKLEKGSIKLTENIINLINEFLKNKNQLDKIDVILAVNIPICCVLCYIADIFIKEDSSQSFKIEFIEEIARMATEKYRNTDKMN